MSRRDREAINNLQKALDLANDARIDAQLVQRKSVEKLQELGYEVDTEVGKIHGVQYSAGFDRLIRYATRDGVTAVTIRRTEESIAAQEEELAARDRFTAEGAHRKALAFVIQGLGLATSVDRFESDLKAAIDLRDEETARKTRQAAADRIKALNPNPLATGGLLSWGSLTVDGAISAAKLATEPIKPDRIRASDVYGPAAKLTLSDEAIAAVVKQLKEHGARIDKSAKKKPATPEKDCS